MNRLPPITLLMTVLIAAGCSGDSVPFGAAPPGLPPAPAAPPPPAPPPATAVFDLLPVQVVPATNSRATGVAEMTSTATQLRISVTTYGLDAPMEAHVHSGIAGTNGPVLFDLDQDPAAPERWFSGDLDIAANNFDLYVDVHTAAFPDGEIRAQLPGDTPYSIIPLMPRDTVPARSGAELGTAAVTTTDFVGWDWDPEVTVHAWLDPSVVATSVVIAYAAIGQNGPDMHALSRDPGNPSHWYIENQLLAPPVPRSEFAGYYFSVATQAQPGGAARGQLYTRNSFYEESTDRFQVVSLNPWDGATLKALPVPISLRFNASPDPDSLTTSTVRLQASGGDHGFLEGNETWFDALSLGTNDLILSAVFDSAALADDTYRIVVSSGDADGLVDKGGRPLNGHYGNPGEKSDYVSTFRIDAGRPPPATLGELQDEIFTPGCALSGCHDASSAAGSLILEEGLAWQALYEVRSVDWDNWGILYRVAPRDPDASWIVRKIDPYGCCVHPRGDRRLGNHQYQMLREWIADGAVDN